MRRFIALLGVLALAFGVSTAMAEIGLTGIGGHLDYVDPEDVDSAIGFGGLVDLGYVVPHIGIEGNVDFWSKSYDIGGGFVDDSKVKFRDIAIGATGKYYFATDEVALRPFAGAGLGLHLLHSEVDYSDTYFGGSTADDDETKLGIDLCGGTLYGVNSKLDLLGEFRYRLVSDFNQMVLRAGIIYRMGQNE